MITPQDKELLENKGISEEQIAEQLACFEKGFPYLKLSAAASVEKGILAPDTDEQKMCIRDRRVTVVGVLNVWHIPPSGKWMAIACVVLSAVCLMWKGLLRQNALYCGSVLTSQFLTIRVTSFSILVIPGSTVIFFLSLV